jgi:hypothetical protein
MHTVVEVACAAAYLELLSCRVHGRGESTGSVLHCCGRWKFSLYVFDVWQHPWWRCILLCACMLHNTWHSSCQWPRLDAVHGRNTSHVRVVAVCCFVCLTSWHTVCRMLHPAQRLCMSVFCILGSKTAHSTEQSSSPVHALCHEVRLWCCYVLHY